MKGNEITLQSLQDQINDIKAEIVEISVTLASKGENGGTATSSASSKSSGTDDSAKPSASLTVALGTLALAYLIGAASSRRRARQAR